MLERSWLWYWVALVSLVAAIAVPSDTRASETADLKFVRASFTEAYTEVAEAWGLKLGFDRAFKGGVHVTVEMQDVDAFEALDTLAGIGGHLIAVGQHDELIVADDTPQNQREYTSLRMETFAPQFISAKDVDKLLRSMIEARRISANEKLQTVSMRDTAAKICVARKLLAVIDQPPSEIDLEIQLIQLAGEGAGMIPHRVDRDAMRKLSSHPEASVLASFGLTLTGSEYSSIEFSAPSDLPGMMSLRAQAANRFGTGDVTLSYRFDWSRHYEAGEHRRTDQISGAAETVSLSEGWAVVLPMKIASAEEVMILAIEPRIIRPSAFDPATTTSFEVGTESGIRCDAPDPLARALEGAELVREPVPVIRTAASGPFPGAAPPRGVQRGYDGQPRPYVIAGPPAEEPPAEPSTTQSDETPD